MNAKTLAILGVSTVLLLVVIWGEPFQVSAASE